MAKLTLGGTDYEIRPFKLREIRAAAPFIDRVWARSRGGETGVAAMADSLSDMLAALAAGVDGVTAADLEAQAGMDDLPAIRDAFNAVLQEAGFKPKSASGEAKPAAPPADLSPTE